MLLNLPSRTFISVFLLIREIHEVDCGYGDGDISSAEVSKHEGWLGEKMLFKNMTENNNSSIRPEVSPLYFLDSPCLNCNYRMHMPILQQQALFRLCHKARIKPCRRPLLLLKRRLPLYDHEAIHYRRKHLRRRKRSLARSCQ